jgi:hypothetical protein
MIILEALTTLSSKKLPGEEIKEKPTALFPVRDSA